MFNPKSSDSKIQALGGIASFLVAVATVTSGTIYLTGNLQDALGPFVYSLADFLYGPVLAISMITAVYALRERLSWAAPRMMNLALLTSIAAACTFVVVASIRSANRNYHLLHPEMHLESDQTILVVWSTLVAGMIGAACHFLGWTFLLIGTAAWKSMIFPRTLSVLYLVAGIMSILVLFIPQMETNALAYMVILNIWQGFLFFTSTLKKLSDSEIKTAQTL